ncbi:universal stress protein [Bizionia arctica]|uniref:Universal stress protein UspA n=1 Tax=Bizionia arctica TaxID=1495645 RepID=A0A917LPI0_9FLAO|nr:universal stress protein [Bizionia arctica]GGG49053.1 universal stress protein UspA [Bizionia arctica]
MKTILVPTDFSETANYALEVAVQLSKKTNSKLVLLHMLEIKDHLLPSVSETNDVINPILSSGGNPPAAVFYMKLAHKNFEALREHKFLEGVTYEEAIQNHLNFNEINTTAKKYQADIIVMGSHGATGLKEVFVGSHTEKVVRSSEIPVIVIKNKHLDFNVKNLVFVTDLKTDTLSTLKKAFAFCKQLDAKLYLLHINTPGDAFMTSNDIDEKINHLVKEAGFDPNKFEVQKYNDRDIEKGIINFSKSIGADLIAIPTHARRGLAHFFNHNLSEEMVNHFDIPVITFKID